MFQGMREITPMMKAPVFTGVMAVFLAVFATCGDSRVEPPPFNAERSFQYLEEQVAFGPRVPGSAAAAECRDYYYRHFAEQGLAVDSQPFAYFDPYSATELRLVNVIARFESANKEAQRIILMAHYDSRPRGEYASDPALRETPIDGANDDAFEDPTHVRQYFPNSFGYFSQPFYWRADYGYRGDWKPEEITLVVRRADHEGMAPEEVFRRIKTLRNVVLEMIAKGFNAPLTSSCGRLFDGVAALLGLCLEAQFEGQAAMLLEAQASSALLERPQTADADLDAYPVGLLQEDGLLVVDSGPLVKMILNDLNSGGEPIILANPRLNFFSTFGSNPQPSP